MICVYIDTFKEGGKKGERKRDVASVLARLLHGSILTYAFDMVKLTFNMSPNFGQALRLRKGE